MPASDRAARAWGGCIARYGRWIGSSGRLTLEGQLPQGSFIGVHWHSANLAIMGVHAERDAHPYRAFVPPGILGNVMRGCLEGYGMEAVPLPKDGAGNAVAGMKEMARALKDGYTTGIAVDGPHGPARVLRPGALWLARLTGRPLVVVGAAAWPSFRAPWWDRHLIPMPHSRMALVYGEPIIIGRDTDIDHDLCARIAESLGDVEDRAWQLVRRPSAGGSAAQ